MATIISVLPEGIWDFYFNNEQRMKKEIVIIAEDTSSGISITITERDLKPFIAVYSKSEMIEGATFIYESEGKDIASKLYQKYIFGSDISDTSTDKGGEPEEETEEKETGEKVEIDTKEDTEKDLEDRIYEREDELTLAFSDYCAVVLDDEEGVLFDEYPDEMEQIKEQFIDLLVIKHGFSIRRPTFIYDVDGKKNFVEYPYEDD